ncbi:MAG: hypothetical protein JSV09_01775 [Thermoplasmata archaeon]|nr:MAG: hypothetical protein JSV09_01775 [Thermoplasmata archaeon]
MGKIKARRYLIVYLEVVTCGCDLDSYTCMTVFLDQGEFQMKVWICDDCGAEVGMGAKPEKCGKCGADELVEIERADESGHGCKGPVA